jgi:predicted phosphodiesterase
MTKRFIFASDLHGDMQDKAAAEALLGFSAMWKPHVKIFGGDLWDFRALRKGASDDERRESMRADYLAGMKFFKTWKPDYFLRGNHDERLWELMERDSGVASDYAGELVGSCEREVKESKCKMLPYHKRDGVLKIGHAKFLHGFFCGLYAAAQHARIYNTCFFGHTHVIDCSPIGGLERRAARGVGALCSLDMEYAARNPNTLRQAHGFAYGVILGDGSFHSWQAEEINGRWILPSDIVEI